MADLSVFYALGFALVVVGIIVVVAVIVKASMGRGGEEKNRVRGAGVIMIGPIPIIFGTDKKSVKEVLWLVLAFVILALIVILVYYWLWR